LTTPNEIVSISRSTSGPATDAAGAAAIFAVIGAAAAGDANTPVLTRNDRDPGALFEGGPLVEFAEIVSSYSRQATIPVRASTANPGAYGALDTSGMSGTVVAAADASYVPYVDAELYVIFDTGGDLGDAEAGITYRTSSDGGRTFGPRTALGSGSAITFSDVHARITLTPPSAALITRVNAARTAILAHLALGTSTHLAADTVNDDGIGSAAATLAGALTLAGQLRTAALAHATYNTSHTADDADSFADLPAAPASSAALAAWLEAFSEAWNDHVATTGSVHGAADATNVVPEADLDAGAIEAGDVIQGTTIGPTMDATALDDAMDALVEFNGSLFGGLIVAGAFDPSTMWTPLINGLDALRASQVPIGVAIVEARPPADGETVAQYRLALAAEWEAYEDERVHVVSGWGRYDPATLDRCAAQRYRSHAAPLAARLAALDYGESPGVPKVSERDRTRPSRFGGPLAGFRIYDDSGNLVGHDERANPGLAAAGFGVVTSYRRAASKTAAHVFQPRNKAPAGNRAPHIAHQRILAVVEGVIYQVGTEEIEARLLYEPGRQTIRADVADAFDAQMRNRVLAETGDPAQTTAARVSRLLVEVDRNAVIDPADPIVPINVEVDTPFYTSAFSVNLQVNRS
jgi:hypothetical protein